MILLYLHWIKVTVTHLDDSWWFIKIHHHDDDDDDDSTWILVNPQPPGMNQQKIAMGRPAGHSKKKYGWCKEYIQAKWCATGSKASESSRLIIGQWNELGLERMYSPMYCPKIATTKNRGSMEMIDIINKLTDTLWKVTVFTGKTHKLSMAIASIALLA